MSESGRGEQKRRGAGVCRESSEPWPRVSGLGRGRAAGLGIVDRGEQMRLWGRGQAKQRAKSDRRVNSVCICFLQRRLRFLDLAAGVFASGRKISWKGCEGSCIASPSQVQSAEPLRREPAMPLQMAEWMWRIWSRDRWIYDAARGTANRQSLLTRNNNLKSSTPRYCHSQH